MKPALHFLKVYLFFALIYFWDWLTYPVEKKVALVEITLNQANQIWIIYHKNVKKIDN